MALVLLVKLVTNYCRLLHGKRTRSIVRKLFDLVKLNISIEMYFFFLKTLHENLIFLIE